MWGALRTYPNLTETWFNHDLQVKSDTISTKTTR